MNLKLFKKRLERFYSSWKKQNKELWGDSDVIVIATPSGSASTSCFNPATTYFFWLLGHNFGDMVEIFTPVRYTFFVPKRQIVAPTLDLEAVHAQLFVVAKEKGNAGMAQMDQIIQEISVSHREALKGASDPLFVGYVKGERPRSELLWRCEHDMINPVKYRTACVNAGLVELFNREEVQINIWAARVLIKCSRRFYNKLALSGACKDKLASAEKAGEIQQISEKEEKGNVEEWLKLSEAGFEACSSEYCLVSKEHDDWELVEAYEKKMVIMNKVGGCFEKVRRTLFS